MSSPVTSTPARAIGRVMRPVPQATSRTGPARPDRLAEEERDVVGARGELLIVEVRIVVYGQVLRWLHRATVGVGPKASARLVRMEPDQLLSPNTLTGMASTPHSRWSVSAGIATGKK